MADLSQLSDDQLKQMLEQKRQPAARSLSDFSDEELGAMLEQKRAQRPWSPQQSIKNFASGAVEGLGGLIGLGLDATAPFVPDTVVDEESGLPRRSVVGDFKYSKKIQEALKPYLSDRDPEYRYARTLGSFAGPGLAAKGAGAIPGIAQAVGPAVSSAMANAGSARSLLSALTGGAGAQAAEDITGDQYLAPLVGAVVGGSAPELIRGAAQSVARGLRAPTQNEIRGTAAKIFKDTTGLNAQELTEAIQNAGDDALSAYRTTAEVTRNAGAAQLEKQLTKSGPGAVEYTRLGDKRAALRDSILDALPKAERVTADATNKALRDAALVTRDKMRAEGRNLWDKLPKTKIVDVGAERGQIANAAKELRGAGSLGVDARLKTLIQNFTSSIDPAVAKASGVKATDKAAQGLARQKTVGYLTNIRKDAGFLAKKFYEVGNEQQGALADSLVDAIDTALKRGLDGDEAQIMQEALASTGKRKQVFGRTTAGGALVNQNARVSNLTSLALQGGDAQAVKELRAAIGDKPELIEQVNRVVLDSIKRDAQGRLTPARMSGFIDSRKTMLKELLGDERFTALRKVSDDLVSEASVADLAFRASRGNSVTAQSQTVAGALRDAMLEGLVPGGGIAGRAFEELQKVAAIKSKEQINELLLQAALNPRMARDLALAPTRERVMAVAQRLVQTIKDMGTAGATAGTLEGARLQFNESPAPLQEEAARRQQLKAGSSELESPEQQVDNPLDQGAPSPEASQPGEMKQDVVGFVSQLSPLIQAVIMTESSGKPNARSPKGARGLMQVMPEHYKRLGVTDPDDPMQSVKAGTQILQEELERFDNDPYLALAAYNAGSPKVIRAIAKAGSKDFTRIYPFLPKETQEYVSKIVANFQRIQKGANHAA